MKDELKRNFYIKEVASKYDIYESVLYRELERWTADRSRGGLPGLTRVEKPLLGRPSGEEANAATSPMTKKEMPVGERDILKLLIEHQADMISLIFSHISISDLWDPQARKIVELLLARFDERGPGGVTELVGEIEDPSLKSIVTDIVISKYELSKQWESSDAEIETADPMTIARDAIAALKKRQLQKQIEENQRALKEASIQGADAQPLVQRHQDLMRQLIEVESGAMFKTT